MKGLSPQADRLGTLDKNLSEAFKKKNTDFEDSIIRSALNRRSGLQLNSLQTKSGQPVQRKGNCKLIYYRRDRLIVPASKALGGRNRVPSHHALLGQARLH